MMYDVCNFSSPLKYNDILATLTGSTAMSEDALFHRARTIRQAHLGSRIFLYGFIYLSTHCRNSCTFCYFSKKNAELARYRKNLTHVLEIAQKLADDGVHLLDLTLGEDPYFLQEKGFQELLEMIQKAKQLTGLAIMVSPGVLPKAYYTLLKEAGADWYACYQENHVFTEFTKLRPGQDFALRNAARVWAHEAGLLVEDGLLTGTGENLESLAYSLDVFRNSKLSQSRIMTYVGHESTIPAHEVSKNTELRAISLLRLLNPNHLIPASLDIDGLEGLASRIQAGANVVTSIVPHGFGLSGVASQEKDIENAQRSVKAVTAVLESLGLQVATASDYQAWIAKRRASFSSKETCLEDVCSL